MPPPPHTKPENVLKRAQELIGVNQSQAALSLLHEHVTSKRTRNNPIASIEPVMLLFVELCVTLRKGKSAKDGLYSYKNTAQNTNVGTIEMVLKKFIELAEAKVTEAQEKADQVQSTLDTGAPSTSIDDLEATETPESILLSTVSGEQSRDRTDRAIVTPWLKFLWETYRTVLDILKNNARLEVLYQSTAHQAFQFCLKYTRKTEFRRLCELLRNHLQNAAKYQSQIHAINLSDPDTLQRHLDTRFQQLNVAVELELWQEAFRSIEDIHTLLNLSKRPAKPVMMANYFEKLSTIFLVSENYLFHAAALNRYLNLLRGTTASVAAGQSQKKDNPTVTDADLSNISSFVILSALAIPVISTSRSRGALLDVDEARKNKHQRLTNLLGLPTAPSRASLFKDILSKGLLKRARPEIRDLYNILEVDFHPLSICKKISPILSQIGADPEMGKYVLPLQQVILTRLFQQLSQVYESVDLKFVLSLAQFPDPFQVSSGTIEKFIMNGCKKGDLAIRIDHATGVLTFDADVFSSAKALHPGSISGSAESESGSVQRLQNTPAEIVRSQLSRLAKTLYITCQYVSESFIEDQHAARSVALQRAEAGAEKEHADTLERRGIIERKKQAAATAAAQKEREEETRRLIRAQQQREAEKQRQAELQRNRDNIRMKSERDRLRREENRKQLQEIGDKIDIDISEIDLDELDSSSIRAMKLAALEREKNEIGERLRITGKRNDHLERAFRREEMKHLPADYEAQIQRDHAEYEQTKAETLRDAEQKHQEDLALKNRLSRLVPRYETFRENVRTERHAQFEKQRRIAEQELRQKKDARIREVRDRRIREQREREAREQAEREEEERVQREAEEKAAADEERRQRLAEEKVKREEERRRLDEQAEKQRQREAEAEAKLQARKSGAPTRMPERTAASPSAGMERSDSSGPPRVGLGKSAGGWREREAARLAAQASQPSAVAQEDTPPPTAGSRLVPPALRRGADGATPPPAGSQGDTPPPASGGRFVPPAMRRGAEGAAPRGESMGDGWRGSPSARDENTSSRYASSRAPREEYTDRTASPANGATPRDMQRSFSGAQEGQAPSADLPSTGAPGKYRPGAFRNRAPQ